MGRYAHIRVQLVLDPNIILLRTTIMTPAGAGFSTMCWVEPRRPRWSEARAPVRYGRLIPNWGSASRISSSSRLSGLLFADQPSARSYKQGYCYLSSCQDCPCMPAMRGFGRVLVLGLERWQVVQPDRRASSQTGRWQIGRRHHSGTGRGGSYLCSHPVQGSHASAFDRIRLTGSGHGAFNGLPPCRLA